MCLHVLYVTYVCNPIYHRPFLWSQANIALQTWRPSPRKSACFARSPALCEALGHQQSPVRWRLNPLSLSSLCDRTDAKRPPRPNRLHWYLHQPLETAVATGPETEAAEWPVKWRGPRGPRPLGSSKPNAKATRSAQCLRAERVRVSSAGTNLNGSNSYPTRGFPSARKWLICLTAPLASVRIGCQTIAPPQALDTPPANNKARLFDRWIVWCMSKNICNQWSMTRPWKTKSDELMNQPTLKGFVEGCLSQRLNPLSLNNHPQYPTLDLGSFYDAAVWGELYTMFGIPNSPTKNLDAYWPQIDHGLWKSLEIPTSTSCIGDAYQETRKHETTDSLAAGLKVWESHKPAEMRKDHRPKKLVCHLPPHISWLLSIASIYEWIQSYTWRAKQNTAIP